MHSNYSRRGGVQGRNRKVRSAPVVRDVTDASSDGEAAEKSSARNSPLFPSSVAVGPLSEAASADARINGKQPQTREDKFQFGAPLHTQRHLHMMQRLSEALTLGTLTMINLSHRGLTANDALLLKVAIQQNPNLSVLKLGYNTLGDAGAVTIASAICQSGSQWSHHPNLSILDLGFNCIGDEGCSALAERAIGGNAVLKKIYLSGNAITERGALAISSVLLQPCGLTTFHISQNRIGAMGVAGLSKVLAEAEARKLIGRRAGMPARAKAIAETSTSLVELHLGGTGITNAACVSLSQMLMVNCTLRVLNLSNNSLGDKDMAAISQSFARNKSLPLEALNLSFNYLSCVGVECLMNAIWGSSTMKELKLDNNIIRDRGTQLAAVVLTSINLEVLDLGFNNFTSVGVRSLMKALSENSSLRSLSLSGISMDTNSAKAISFALAYNSTLRTLRVDNSSVSYSAQRHIAAGIVSNSNLMLSLLTGFQLGAVVVTLGFPAATENWSNDQILKFIRFMWLKRRTEDAQSWRRHQGHQRGRLEEATPLRNKGPADPKTVVEAAETAFQTLGGKEFPPTEKNARPIEDASPVVSIREIMYERTPAGITRVPEVMERYYRETHCFDDMERRTESFNHESQKRSSDQERKKKNLEWLASHLQELNRIAGMPFRAADLWDLHQHYFSPAETVSVHKTDQGTNSETDSSEDDDSSKAPGLINGRRRSLDECTALPQPASKRTRTYRPRISFYPRIKAKLDELMTSRLNEGTILTLLRELKFVENFLLRGSDAYYEGSSRHAEISTTTDVEMILVDFL